MSRSRAAWSVRRNRVRIAAIESFGCAANAELRIRNSSPTSVASGWLPTSLMHNRLANVVCGERLRKP